MRSCGLRAAIGEAREKYLASSAIFAFQVDNTYIHRIKLKLSCNNRDDKPMCRVLLSGIRACENIASNLIGLGIGLPVRTFPTAL